MPLFHAFKDTLYCDNKDDVTVENILIKAQEHGDIPTAYVHYVTSLMDRKESWAHAFRKDIGNHAQATNNTAEAAMKVFKEKVCFFNILKRNSPTFNIIVVTRVEHIPRPCRRIYEMHCLSLRFSYQGEAICKKK